MNMQNKNRKPSQKLLAFRASLAELRAKIMRDPRTRNTVGFALAAVIACAVITWAQPAAQMGSLKAPAQIPIVMDGKAVGSTTLPAGTKVTVLRQDAATGKTLVKAAMGEAWVSSATLEIAQAPQVEAQKGAVAPVVAAAPKVAEQPAATPAPTAAPIAAAPAPKTEKKVLYLYNGSEYQDLDESLIRLMREKGYKVSILGAARLATKDASYMKGYYTKGDAEHKTSQPSSEDMVPDLFIGVENGGSDKPMPPYEDYKQFDAFIIPHFTSFRWKLPLPEIQQAGKLIVAGEVTSPARAAEFIKANKYVWKGENAARPLTVKSAENIITFSAYPAVNENPELMRGPKTLAKDLPTPEAADKFVREKLFPEIQNQLR